MDGQTTLTENIKAEARRLGFTLVGVCAPDPPDHLSAYEMWLQAGRHARMEYLAAERARTRRADPHLVLPGVRSIVCLGMPYANPGSAAGTSALPAAGLVAAYAWGTDYHTVIPARLEVLAGGIQRLAGRPVAWKGYTDTGPILERDLAMRAGLGWIGKNTCLIHPRHGSYFLLAELFLDLELTFDAPFTTDHCGSCTRCIDACPTGCILPDRTLDAARCVSYQTIENKGPVDIDLRQPMGNWVFGCDVCQQVCPWNVRFARQDPDAELSARPGVAGPLLREEIQLDSQEFNRKFKDSPLQRPRRRGYLRNVAVALGNSRDEGAVPVLGEVLRTESEALVRAHAAWALGQIGTVEARLALVEAFAAETSEGVRAEIKLALKSP